MTQSNLNEMLIFGFTLSVEPLDTGSALNGLPVFPLPSVVLFPGTILPLHVFEPRYRDMVRDSLAGNRMLAVAQIREENLETHEATLFDVACAGQIIHAEELDDGCYNILVHGLHRVRLMEELPPETLYRRYQASLIPPPDDRSIRHAGIEFGRLQSCMLSLCTAIETDDEQLVEVLRATSDPLELTDILSAAVVQNPQHQQELLETEYFPERVSKLVDYLSEVMINIGRPPPRAMLN